MYLFHNARIDCTKHCSGPDHRNGVRVLNGNEFMTKDRSLGVLQTIHHCHTSKAIEAVTCLPQHHLLFTTVHTGEFMVNQDVLNRTYNT